MGLILMFFLNTNQQIYFLSIIFIVMHGILSAIMFLLIDIIYNETKTRNLINLQGLGVHFTEIKIYL
jgi:NADH:ubiquinone oxidoreductase subunit 4 (subunit M)